MSELPYCYQCSRGNKSGYKNIGNGIWACAVCLKPSYKFWISHVLEKQYWEKLDEIISRIMEKREEPDGLDRGRAETACLFIAMLLYPHSPDVKFVRDMAIRRYRERLNA